MAQAGAEEETIFADIDLAEVGAALAALDTDGHYSRSDIFELRVNTQKNEGVVFE